MLSIAKPLLEPAYDILRLNDSPLETLLNPNTIAIIGASGQIGTVGHTLLWNLIQAPFHGTVYPITPLAEEILGLRTLARVSDVPEPLDLAIVVSPLAEIPQILHACVMAGVKSALLVSSGFRESGSIDPDLWHQLTQLVQHHSLHLLGPNSLGIMNPRRGLNATLASAIAQPGDIGFISQSGALCRAILNWSFQEKVGFSHFISMGSMLGVDWGDVIRYLGNDPYTRSIVIHMETLGNAKSFLAAAREVARSKPIVLIKGGQSPAAVKAALSHSGAELGNDEVFTAALQRCGVLRVHRISELFNMAEVLAKRDYHITGSRLAIVTNSGGLGVLATDALIATGGRLAELDKTTIARLNRVLPSEWSHQNPVDILGDADSERFQKAWDIVVQDPHTDGLLVIFTPQGRADPTDTAERLKDSIHRLQQTPMKDKPILASWMGGTEVIAGETLLNRYQIPTYAYPDSAARLFNLMEHHSYNLRGMAEMPGQEGDAQSGAYDVTLASDIIQAATRAKQPVLSPAETHSVLQAYAISMVPTELATSEERAIAKAEALGYPAVLKLPYQPGLHTPDEGGVQLNLRDQAAVRYAYRQLLDRGHSATVLIQPMLDRDGAYELMLSSSIDPQFGPILTVGKGGRLLEIYQDRAVALPPLTPRLARRSLEQTTIFQALSGNQGYPAVNLTALEQLLINLSWLVVNHPRIKSIHINPLWARPDWTEIADSSPSLQATTRQPDCIVLDARIELHDAQVRDTALPSSALRPYPSSLKTTIVLKAGAGAGSTATANADMVPVTLRPVGPHDIDVLIPFLDGLSNQLVYGERSNLLPQNPQRRLQRLQQLCCLNYDHDIALLAERERLANGGTEVLALARLSRLADDAVAEFALMVDEAVQDRGLGTAMVKQLIKFARQRQIQHLETLMRPDNIPLRRLCERLGCQVTPQGPYLLARLDLPPVSPAAAES